MLKIIAEIGSVHDGSFGNACKLIEAAAKAGADAVKFQTHIAEAETLKDAPSPGYFQDEPRYEYFQRTGFSEAQWLKLREACLQQGVEFMSSPFSIEAVALLERTGIHTYKIPSGEVTNLPLLECVAETGKPVLLSSGMSNWSELDAAVSIFDKDKLTLMQCTSLYPCPDEAVGLNVIAEMKQRYGVAVGFSDHTLDCAAAFAAVALGAVVIEKHFTLSRLMYGSDARNSMPPEEFAGFSKGIKSIACMQANPVDKADVSRFDAMREVFQKSVVLGKPVSKGEALTREHLAFKKPGSGISAARYREVIGRKVKANLAEDTLLHWEDFE